MTLRNAITMRGRIERCWLFTFRTSFHQAAAALPSPLMPVRFGDHAYLNVVVSKLRHMRPKGLPEWTGLDYWHVAYRIYARYSPADLPPVEGLAFLRSDADSPLIVATGNLLSSFQFHLAKIEVHDQDERTFFRVDSTEAPMHAIIDRSLSPELPSGSPFGSLAQASERLKYQPAGLSVQGSRVDVLRITRNESAWQARLVQVVEGSFPFLDSFNPTPEICYEVAPIEYQWNRAERYRVDR